MSRIAIFGAGVVGTACAYSLAKAGHRVTLVDRGTLGGACSHGNCGYVCPSHVLPHAGPGAIRSTLRTLFQKNSPLKVRTLTALGNLGWFLSFARRCNERAMLEAAAGIQALLESSRTLYDDLLRNENMNVEWDASGLLFVFNTQHAFEHYKHVNEMLSEKFNMPAAEWDRDKLLKEEPALVPGAVSGGFHYPRDAQLRPDLLMREWRQRLEQRNVHIVEHCELKSFESNGSTAKRALTNAAPIEADAFVIATGAWTPKLNPLLGCKVPILPGKGYSITMPRPALCPKYPLIFEEHRVAVSPFHSGYRIGSTMEFAGYDESMNPKRIQLLKDGAKLYLKEPLTEPVQEQWWGWRPMVFDGKPVIDFSPKFGNVLIAAGHGMLGLSMAPGTGKLASELLSGQTPHLDPAHFSLKRFR